MKKIALKSEFTDWYDDVFFPVEDSDLVWNRTPHTLGKQETLAFLKQKCRLKVPVNGIVSTVAPTILESVGKSMGLSKDDLIAADLFDIDKESSKTKDMRELEKLARQTQRATYNEFTRVIVEADEPVLLYADEAIKHYAEKFCVQYVPTRLDGGSYLQRFLMIGDIGFLVDVASDDWRSSKGNPQYAVTTRFEGRPSYPIENPTYAIDFVSDGKTFYAVSFTISPSLSVVEKFIDADEIYETITGYLKDVN